MDSATTVLKPGKDTKAGRITNVKQNLKVKKSKLPNIERIIHHNHLELMFGIKK